MLTFFHRKVKFLGTETDDEVEMGVGRQNIGKQSKGKASKNLRTHVDVMMTLCSVLSAG